MSTLARAVIVLTSHMCNLLFISLQSSIPDIGGKLETHVDIEFATPKAGQLEVLVESPLIPKLPVKNALTETTKTSVIRGGKKSAWSAVTNLGDGSVLYTNSKTGASQKEKPADIY
mmetsp:Transcript_28976/g.58801  ORF Transcript_28976/g.58801 Transcript_28976/m.58801 type:complete len:116 (-) Transcript_28976:1086-1433(-)